MGNGIGQDIRLQPNLLFGDYNVFVYSLIHGKT